MHTEVVDATVPHPTVCVDQQSGSGNPPLPANIDLAQFVGSNRIHTLSGSMELRIPLHDFDEAFHAVR